MPIRTVDGAIERMLRTQRLVGAVVLIARNGQIMYRRAAGFADREAQRPMREDSIFLLSSLTKPLVTAAAMVLIEQGRLGLDDPVTRWLEDFRPKYDGTEAIITVRQLLTHTAGLSYGMSQPDNGPYRRAGISDGLAEPGLSFEEELRRLAAVPLARRPGTAWGYSLAIDVLGALIARIGGAALPKVVEQLVTAPLGLKDTGFAINDLGRLVVPYVDGLPPRRMGDPDIVDFGGGAMIRFSPSRILNPDSFPSGGAGMAGTAIDFMNFLEALRKGGGPVLEQETVRQMMSNQIGALRVDFEATPSWGFGFGGAVLLDSALAGVPQAAGTWKWGGVYGHHWYVDPEKKLTVLVMTNTTPAGMTGGFAADLMTAVYAAA